MWTESLSQLLAEREEQFSGVLLIQHGDGAIFRAACGLASRAWGAPNRPETRFRIASISKMFTAVSVLQLIDANRLALDTRLAEHLDLSGTTIPDEVTVFHLLTMTAGIADWFEESGDWEANWEMLRRTHPLYLLRRNRDYLPLFSQKPPLHAVGSGHRYSNASYILLGLLIEQLTSMDYFEYVRQNIFAPAGMNDSDFLALDGMDADVAEGYIPPPDGAKDGAKDGAGWRRNIYMTTPEGAADGGATSTAADLVRFSRALRGGQLLPPALTDAMLTPQVSESDEKFRGYTWMYGFGNYFLLDEAGATVRWGHTGEEEGVSCRFYHYPQPGLDVVILGNHSGCAGALGWEVHDLIMSNHS